MSTIGQEPTPLSTIGKLVEAVKGRERWLLGLGIALQLAVLGFMTVKGTLILLHGDTYFVRVMPVDPRDPLRGEFVILSYEFSRVPPHMFEGRNFDAMREMQGRPIYVSLVRDEDGKHWRGVNPSFEKPRNGPFLKGKMGQRGLEFGIEQFFVQEGKGRKYEEVVRSRRLTSEIKVTPEGDAAMWALHIDK